MLCIDLRQVKRHMHLEVNLSICNILKVKITHQMLNKSKKKYKYKTKITSYWQWKFTNVYCFVCYSRHTLPYAYKSQDQRHKKHIILELIPYPTINVEHLKITQEFFLLKLLQAYKELDVFNRAFLKTNYSKNSVRVNEISFLCFKVGGLVIFQSWFRVIIRKSKEKNNLKIV